MKRQFKNGWSVFLLSAIALPVAFLLTSGIAFGESEEGDGHGHGHGHGDEENHIEISDETLNDHDISIETVAPGEVESKLHLNGKVLANENKVAHLMPRFSGVITEVFKGVGDMVEKGTLLATVESNQNLQALQIKSPFAGSILNRHATVGEIASESNDLFVVADLSEVWVDLNVFGADIPKIRVGQEVHLKLANQEKDLETKINFVSSVIEETTQSKFARVVIANPDGLLNPGAFVSAEVVLEKAKVPLLVKASAIQSMEGKNVIFVKDKEALEPREVKVGRNDGENAEIVSGVSIGEQYATGNSFILKAEAGKGEAEHEH